MLSRASLSKPVSIETEADRSEPSEKPGRVLRPRLIIGLALLALLTVAVDQITKTIVVSTMTEGQVVTVIPGVLQWRFVRNAGAAFSFAEGQTWIFSIIAVVVAGVVIWAARRIESRSWAVVFGLLLGGTLGNLIDRLFREPGFGIGRVIDFIFLPWMMPAIFNVADMAISAAVVILGILIITSVGFDGKRARSDKKSTAQSDV